jgi:hypothetical protein
MANHPEGWGSIAISPSGASANFPRWQITPEGWGSIAISARGSNLKSGAWRGQGQVRYVGAAGKLLGLGERLLPTNGFEGADSAVEGLDSFEVCADDLHRRGGPSPYRLG